MAKLFTITEGLENLGALKTGGQGSVYKGKRLGEIYTAIKLLPTPILSEDANDKNYRSFINEVEKLKRVNEEPNPNVVRILGSGITETGCLPYIEMEYIEGPDLGELLKPPHEPVFSIQEVVKVACHISIALAHCHRCDVKHGDIKSNNIKYNIHTGNYVLLDFGLAIMSDEDRRTSLRHAGAIEFMAPEQNEGKVFFETDIYSFGVILFELLAGRVPFPLQDSGETARNAVMLSHIETPPPDVQQLRRQNMPEHWLEEKPWEAHIPEWLLNMVYRCLEKKPEQRFRNGMELQDYVNSHSSIHQQKQVFYKNSNEEVAQLLRENQELRQQVALFQQTAEATEEKMQSLKQLLLQHERNSLQSGTPPAFEKRSTVSRKAFYLLLFFALVLSAGLIYSIVSNNSVDSASLNAMPIDSTAVQDSINRDNEANKAASAGNSNSKSQEKPKPLADENTTQGDGSEEPVIVVDTTSFFKNREKPIPKKDTAAAPLQKKNTDSNKNDSTDVE